MPMEATCTSLQVTFLEMQSLFNKQKSQMGFPGGLAEVYLQCRRCKRRRFNPWVGKIPWRRAWQPTPVFLPGESHGQGSFTDYSPWSRKESDTTEVTEHPCKSQKSLREFPDLCQGSSRKSWNKKESSKIDVHKILHIYLRKKNLQRNYS